MSTNPTVTWKIYCRSSRSNIFTLLSTAQGRESFWAESAREQDGNIHFVFPNGQTYISRILDCRQDTLLRIIYFDSEVEFKLIDVHSGGTEVIVTHTGVSRAEYDEVKAGWVSVLLALKAVADFGVDLRNHDGKRTWEQGFADN